MSSEIHEDAILDFYLMILEELPDFGQELNAVRRRWQQQSAFSVSQLVAREYVNSPGIACCVTQGAEQLVRILVNAQADGEIAPSYGLLLFA
jgi:hypothetical protein